MECCIWCGASTSNPHRFCCEGCYENYLLTSGDPTIWDADTLADIQPETQNGKAN